MYEKIMQFIREFFNDFFGYEAPDDEEKESANPCESGPQPVHESRGVRKTIDEVYGWQKLISLLIFGVLITGVIAVFMHFDKNDSKDNHSLQSQERFYLMQRHHTIEQIVGTWSTMHLDAGIIDAYEEAKQLTGEVNCETDPVLWSLARLYYAGGSLLLASTYVPIIINTAGGVDGLVMTAISDLPDNYHISHDIEGDSIPIIPALHERTLRRNALEDLYSRASERHNAGCDQELQLLVPALQKLFNEALIFYIEMNGLLDSSGIEHLKSEAYQKAYQSLLADSTRPVLTRYLAVTVFQDKQFFNILTSLYYIYDKISGGVPDPAAVMEYANTMDAIEGRGETISQWQVFVNLAEASEIVDTMTMMMTDALNCCLDEEGEGQEQKDED